MTSQVIPPTSTCETQHACIYTPTHTVNKRFYIYTNYCLALEIITFLEILFLNFKKVKMVEGMKRKKIDEGYINITSKIQETPLF